MTSIHIDGLTKKFGTFTALDNVSIEIPDGKFVCLLGPSGCGKTTLLRVIAGLEEETSGGVIVGDQNQNGVPAHKRGFGMVFQSLALFPHLTVAENIAYPLRIRGVSKEKRRGRALELLELVKMPDVADRQIHQLSGGQRQRIAIARGLAIDPKLFLLDEPLSALDAKLREHMQIELRMLQQKLKITTIVVTHDQREVMTMADIVVVMKDGVIQQAGSPIEIYSQPANAFVADFIGQTNLLECTIKDAQSVELFGKTFIVDATVKINAPKKTAAMLSARPEDVKVTSREENHTIEGEVEFIRDLGATIEIITRANGQEILSISSPTESPNVNVGDAVGILINAERCTVMSS